MNGGQAQLWRSLATMNDGQAELRRSLATMEQELQEVREEAEFRYSGLHGEQCEFLCSIRTVGGNWGCTAFSSLLLRLAGSDLENVCQKNSFLKVSVSLGGFGPFVAHGKHSVRRRCVQATKNKAEACPLLDAIGRRSCGR